MTSLEDVGGDPLEQQFGLGFPPEGGIFGSLDMAKAIELGLNFEDIWPEFAGLEDEGFVPNAPEEGPEDVYFGIPTPEGPYSWVPRSGITLGEGWVELSVPTHSEAAIWRSGDGQGGIPTELQLLRLDLYDFHHGLTAIEKPLPASSTDLPLLGSPLEVASPAEGDSNVVVDYNSLTGNVGQAKAARLSFLRETFRNRVSQQGPDSERWCRTCYHMGHDDPSDQVACPVARIRTYLDQSFVAPYIVGEAMGITHIDLFFIDVPIILEGYFWAVDMVRAGDGHIFGITIPEVRRLEGLVEKCEGLKKLGLILPQEGFEGMDQPFLGPHDWAGVEESFPDGVIIQKLEDPPESLLITTEESTEKVAPLPKKPRRNTFGAKAPNLCDKANLDPIGERTASVCSNCFYRGHISSSTVVCPYQIVMAAIKLSKGGGRWRKDEKYPRAVHLLEKMFNIMEEASDDRRNRDHSSLREILETWEEIKDETESPPKPISRKRRSSMDDYVPKDDSVPPSRRIVEFVSKGFDLDLMLLTEVGACPEPIYAGICEANGKPCQSLIDTMRAVRKEFIAYQFKQLGNRSDTRCISCLHYGHDTRARVCLLTEVRNALDKDTLVSDWENMHPKILALQKMLWFNQGFPRSLDFSKLKVDDSKIIELFKDLREVFGNGEGEVELNLHPYDSMPFIFRLRLYGGQPGAFESTRSPAIQQTETPQDVPRTQQGFGQNQIDQHVPRMQQDFGQGQSQFDHCVSPMQKDFGQRQEQLSQYVPPIQQDFGVPPMQQDFSQGQNQFGQYFPPMQQNFVQGQNQFSHYAPQMQQDFSQVQDEIKQEYDYGTNGFDAQDQTQQIEDFLVDPSLDQPHYKSPPSNLNSDHPDLSSNDHWMDNQTHSPQMAQPTSQGQQTLESPQVGTHQAVQLRGPHGQQHAFTGRLQSPLSGQHKYQTPSVFGQHTGQHTPQANEVNLHGNPTSACRPTSAQMSRVHPSTPGHPQTQIQAHHGESVQDQSSKAFGKFDHSAMPGEISAFPHQIRRVSGQNRQFQQSPGNGRGSHPVTPQVSPHSAITPQFSPHTPTPRASQQVGSSPLSGSKISPQSHPPFKLNILEMSNEMLLTYGHLFKLDSSSGEVFVDRGMLDIKGTMELMSFFIR